MNKGGGLLSSESRFVENVIKNIMLQVHTNQPARVIKYFPDTKPPSADIEYLFMARDKQGDLSKHAMVEAVPVVRHVGPLVKGDVVWVEIAERAMDDFQKVPFDPGMRRMFNLNDGVITGVFDL